MFSVNLNIIETVMTFIILISAYLVSVLVNGISQSWVLEKLGDRRVQPISLNPFEYIDIVGILCVIFFGIGWGKVIPVDATLIRGKWRSLKLLFAYGAESIVAFLLTLIALIGSVFLAGPQSLRIGLMIFFNPSMSLEKFTKFFPNHSSLAIIAILFLIAIVFLNALITTWSVIINSFRYLLTIFSEVPFFVQHGQAILLWGPIITLLFFAHFIRMMILYSVVNVAYQIAHLSGVA